VQGVEYAEDPTLAEGEDEYVFAPIEAPRSDDGRGGCDDGEDELASRTSSHNDDDDDDDDIAASGAKPARERGAFVLDRAAVARAVQALMRAGEPLSLLTTLREWLDGAKQLGAPCDVCFVPCSPAEANALRERAEARRLLLALGLLPPSRVHGPGFRALWRLPKEASPSETAAVLSESVSDALARDDDDDAPAMDVDDDDDDDDAVDDFDAHLAGILKPTRSTAPKPPARRAKPSSPAHVVRMRHAVAPDSAPEPTPRRADESEEELDVSKPLASARDDSGSDGGSDDQDDVASAKSVERKPARSAKPKRVRSPSPPASPVAAAPAAAARSSSDRKKKRVIAAASSGDDDDDDDDDDAKAEDVAIESAAPAKRSRVVVDSDSD